MTATIRTPSVLLITKGLDIGGIERIVVDLAVAFNRRGVAVEVAVVNSRRNQFLPRLIESGIVVHELGGTDNIGWAAGRKLRALVRDQRFDVVHVHGPLPAVVARLTPRHRPIITTSHTPLHGLRRSTRLAWQLTSRIDAATLAVSAGVAASMPRGTAHRTAVLPHGVDLEAISTALAQRAEPPADHSVTALAVASHRDVKNYPNLLRAIQRAHGLGVPLRLVAIGAGPGLTRHRELARELGLGDAVTFNEPVTDVLKQIAAADLVVVASDYEGQPMVVLEALALGRPIVATAVGRVPELVDASFGRVVRPGDSEALGQALAEVAGDAALRDRMTQSAFAAAPSITTLDDAVGAHLALYNEILGR